jgi:signal transduction histidine kinase
MVLDNLRDLRMDDIAEDMNKILYSANHLKSVVNDILDVSRIEAGQLELKPEPVNLDNLIQEVVEATEPLSLCTHNRIILDLAEPEIVLEVDRIRLRQILYNLLSNAAKFTHSGTISVKTRLAGDGNKAQVLVSDTGIGMSAGDAASVFERFYRSEAHVMQYNQGGTGLGLAICKILVEAMNGTIEVDSAEGEGSTFTVTLPFEPHENKKIKFVD